MRHYQCCCLLSLLSGFWSISLCDFIVQAFPTTSKHNRARNLYRRIPITYESSFLHSVPNVQKDIVTTASPLTKNVIFRAPLLEYGYAPTVQEFQDSALAKKPILVYLPGFDGTYICPFIQFPELGTEFDVWCMTVGMDDRSTFEELKENVMEFISTVDDDRPLYIAGESFGGILACEVTNVLLSLGNDKDSVSGLILINPATSYDRSALQVDGPPVAQLPSLLYPLGLMKLLPLFMDEFSFSQLLLILSAEALPSVIDTPAREAYMGRVAISLPTKLEYMPQETLNWRLTEWLATGCEQTKATLKDLSEQIQLKTLIIAGEKDLTLPSVKEGERLSNLLPSSHFHVVEDAGHSSTCGSRVDLAAVIRSHFQELQGSANSKRTAMKQAATIGEGPSFGMTERYDGADVGLSPMEYWSNENYMTIDISTEISNNGKFRIAVYKSKLATAS